MKPESRIPNLVHKDELTPTFMENEQNGKILIALLSLFVAINLIGLTLYQRYKITQLEGRLEYYEMIHREAR